jgi:hypothetical protein
MNGKLPAPKLIISIIPAVGKDASNACQQAIMSKSMHSMQQMKLFMGQMTNTREYLINIEYFAMDSPSLRKQTCIVGADDWRSGKARAICHSKDGYKKTMDNKS